MLAPEVWDFPPPKVITSHKENHPYDKVLKSVNMNSFYKSAIIACPDETRIPIFIEEIVTGDTDYYKIWDCPITEFIQPAFIHSFVEPGNLYCLSSGRNCVIHNCAAVTPDGHLALHVYDYIYRSLGIEGSKQLHNFYKIKIDLKSIKEDKYEKLFNSLSKLEKFDFYVSWEPNNPDVCPSSVAKYFHDRDIKVTLESMKVKHITPMVSSVPSVKDVHIEEMVEWLGMLAHEANVESNEMYISRYVQPCGENSLNSNKISLLVVKGFLLPKLMNELCDMVKKHVEFRQLDNYWASLSIQSFEHSLWRWEGNHPPVFLAHDSSYNVFFTHHGITVYSVGQMIYS